MRLEISWGNPRRFKSCRCRIFYFLVHSLMKKMHQLVQFNLFMFFSLILNKNRHLTNPRKQTIKHIHKFFIFILILLQKNYWTIINYKILKKNYGIFLFRCSYKYYWNFIWDIFVGIYRFINYIIIYYYFNISLFYIYWFLY